MSDAHFARIREKTKTQQISHVKWGIQFLWAWKRI